MKKEEIKVRFLEEIFNISEIIKQALKYKDSVSL
jgi:hypothetical protein